MTSLYNSKHKLFLTAGALFFLSFLILFSVPLASAITWNIDFTTVNVNSSNYWDTGDYGPMRDILDISHSWLNNLEWSVAGHIIDTNLDMNSYNIQEIDKAYFDSSAFISSDDSKHIDIHANYIDLHGNLSTIWTIKLDADGDGLGGDGYGDLIFGSGGDTYLYYNGSDFIIDPDAVGSGIVYIDGNLSSDYFFGSGAYLTELNVSGNVSVGGDLDMIGYSLTTSFLGGVVGTIEMRGDPWYLSGTSLQIVEDLYVDRNFYVGENSSLSDVFPQDTLNYSLGSGPLRWLNLFVQNINVDDIETINLHVSDNVTADYFKGDLEIDFLAGSSNTTIQDYINSVQSAGRISGGEFTDNGDGTITVASGLGFIKTTNNQIGNTVFFEWETNVSVSLYNGSMSRIFVDYNSGNPIIKRDGTLNHNTELSLGTAFLCSLTGEVHILSGGQPAFNLARLVHYRLREPGIQKISGALLGEPNGLNLSVTEGVFWAGLNRFTTGSFDSTGLDNFSYFYQNGSNGWFIQEGISIINNTHYDDGSGTLNELTVNRYGVHWVYNDNDGHIFILYGYGDYVLGGANNAEPPSTVPTILSGFGTLLGKIIVQKGDTTFTEILSILPEDIPPSVVTEHGELTGLGDDDHTQYLLADGTRALTGSLTLANGGQLWDNATCTFISSPDGSNIQEICNI